MTRETRGSLLSVSFTGDRIKIAEVEALEKQYRINKITQNRLEVPFDFNAIKQEDSISKISNSISQIKMGMNFQATRTAFTLESQWGFIKKFPVEPDLSDEELKEQVKWEVEQFLFSTDIEYVIDFQKLVPVGQEGPQEMVVVAVRKSIIDYIKRIFDAAKLELEIIDIDVFAAIRAVMTNYECRAGEKIALIDVGHTQLLVSILRNGEFYLTQEVAFFSEEEETKVAGFPSDEDLSKLISKELRRIILDSKLGETIEDLNRIFLYGEMVKDVVLETLQNTYNVRIDRANPFRRLRFAPNVNVDEYIWSRPEIFTVCIGAALRKN